ncbi:MAG: hypothetical protein ACK4UU_07945, partial [Fimbriimonadales bacterium]
MRFCSAARVNLVGVLLLCSFGVLANAIEPRAALEEARKALEQAYRLPSAQRKPFLKQAKRALAPLPPESRSPLEQRIADAEHKGDLATIKAALESVEAYQQAMQPPSPAPSPQQVKAQLDAIFTEPDMQIPPKSLLERASEALQGALEAFLRWL